MKIPALIDDITENRYAVHRSNKNHPMLILTLFAFIAGIITILSPCILPVLPILLSSGISGMRRPIGIITGFIGSFTLVTLLLHGAIQSFGIPADSIRTAAIVLIGVSGATLLFPSIQAKSEQLITPITRVRPAPSSATGFVGGLIIGMSLGIVWSPCVGPILAAVMSLAVSGIVSGEMFAIVLAYALGTSVPMLLIAFFGKTVFDRFPASQFQPASIQRFFGGVMIVTAIAMAMQLDRAAQTWIVSTFPDYTDFVTKIEEFAPVRDMERRHRPPDPDDPCLPENRRLIEARGLIIFCE